MAVLTDEWGEVFFVADAGAGHDLPTSDRFTLGQRARGRPGARDWMERWLKAVHQKSGKVLWQFKTVSGINRKPDVLPGPR
jgi:hypothetical protein